MTGKIFIGADVSITRAPVLQIHAIADLSDLQRKIPAIISSIKLPTDNCGSYSGNNPMVSLSNPNLLLAGGQAVFHTDGDVAMWDCRENPIPNSKVEMQMRDISVAGFKVGKTKVPVVVLSPGNPIKNKLGTQPFSIDSPFGVRVVNGTAVELIPAEAHLNLSGQYVEITKEIVRLLNADLDKKLNEAIRNAEVDPENETVG